eukprot:Hpha_TRINITY_DN2090_c0_g1::TRINITY_DN2090_c0_g1_i1::g.83047::m.83047
MMTSPPQRGGAARPPPMPAMTARRRVLFNAPASGQSSARSVPSKSRAVSHSAPNPHRLLPPPPTTFFAPPGRAVSPSPRPRLRQSSSGATPSGVAPPRLRSPSPGGSRVRMASPTPLPPRAPRNTGSGRVSGSRSASPTAAKARASPSRERGAECCEYLYLQDGCLDRYEPQLPLARVKLLDLCRNSIRSVLFLWSNWSRPERELRLPMLRHLFLTGNALTSFEGLSGLPHLETLTVSNNRLSSFEFLGSLPELQFLAAQHNRISSFKHFPHLPKLCRLSLDSNPIAGCGIEQRAQGYRTMALAVAPTLVQVDAKPVSAQEKLWGESWGGVVQHAILEGFIVDSCGDQTQVLTAAAQSFCLRSQQEATKSGSFRVHHVAITGDSKGPEEGSAVEFSLALEDHRGAEEARDRALYCPFIAPMAFRVSGKAQRVSMHGPVVGGWGGKGVALRREGGDFVCTLYLPVGRHPYRYLVDGVQVLDEPRGVGGESGEPCCWVSAQGPSAADAEDCSRGGELHMRWLRGNESGGFEPIAGATELKYHPTAADVGKCLRAEVLWYIGGELRGVAWAITERVRAPPPAVGLELEGCARVGHVLRAACQNVSGRQPGKYRWRRVARDGKVTELRHTGKEYLLLEEDLESRIAVVYRAIQEDGVVGKEVEALSGEVGGDAVEDSAPPAPQEKTPSLPPASPSITSPVVPLPTPPSITSPVVPLPTPPSITSPV